MKKCKFEGELNKDEQLALFIGFLTGMSFQGNIANRRKKVNKRRGEKHGKGKSKVKRKQDSK